MKLSRSLLRRSQERKPLPNDKHINELLENMENLRHIANRTDEVRDRAILYQDKIVPLMQEIRTLVDDLERLIDDEFWTLPKYRELLFIH